MVLVSEAELCPTEDKHNEGVTRGQQTTGLVLPPPRPTGSSLSPSFLGHQLNKMTLHHHQHKTGTRAQMASPRDVLADHPPFPPFHNAGG